MQVVQQSIKHAMQCIHITCLYTQDIQNTFNVHVFGLAKERMYMKTHICSQVPGIQKYLLKTDSNYTCVCVYSIVHELLRSCVL